jgi:hypothetical protein
MEIAESVMSKSLAGMLVLWTPFVATTVTLSALQLLVTARRERDDTPDSAAVLPALLSSEVAPSVKFWT